MKKITLTPGVSIMDIVSMLGVLGALLYFIFFAGADSTGLYNELQMEISANTTRVIHLDKEIKEEKKQREKTEKDLKEAIRDVQRRQEVIRTEQRQDMKEQSRKLDAIIRRLPNGD